MRSHLCNHDNWNWGDITLDVTILKYLPTYLASLNFSHWQHGMRRLEGMSEIQATFLASSPSVTQHLHLRKACFSLLVFWLTLITILFCMWNKKKQRLPNEVNASWSVWKISWKELLLLSKYHSEKCKIKKKKRIFSNMIETMQRRGGLLGFQNFSFVKNALLTCRRDYNWRVFLIWNLYSQLSHFPKCALFATQNFA